MPLVIFLILLLGLPMLELSLFAEVAQEVGTFNTILLTIFTAVVGVALVRQQGLQVVQSLSATVQRGESPVKEIIHGVFLFLAGLFLLLPGFFTDSLGALLLIPPVRSLLANSGVFTMIVKAPKPRQWHHHEGDATDHHQSYHVEQTIIEGEFSEVDQENADKNEDKKP